MHAIGVQPRRPRPFRLCRRRVHSRRTGRSAAAERLRRRGDGAGLGAARQRAQSRQQLHVDARQQRILNVHARRGDAAALRAHCALARADRETSVAQRDRFAAAALAHVLSGVAPRRLHVAALHAARLRGGHYAARGAQRHAFDDPQADVPQSERVAAPRNAAPRSPRAATAPPQEGTYRTQGSCGILRLSRVPRRTARSRSPLLSLSLSLSLCSPPLLLLFFARSSRTSMSSRATSSGAATSTSWETLGW